MNCISCRWYSYSHNGEYMAASCELGRKLEWCSQYEREPGSDDVYTDDTQMMVIDRRE